MQVAAAHAGSTCRLPPAGAASSASSPSGTASGAESALLDADNQPLDALQLGDMERLHAILRWSALPGTSRHHWGTDLDIYDPDCLPAGTKLALEPWGMRRGLVCRLERVAGRSHERLRLLPALCQGATGSGVAYEPWHLSFAPSPTNWPWIRRRWRFARKGRILKVRRAYWPISTDPGPLCVPGTPRKEDLMSLWLWIGLPLLFLLGLFLNAIKDMKQLEAVAQIQGQDPRRQDDEDD